jgi:hypothetical protein
VQVFGKPRVHSPDARPPPTPCRGPIPQNWPAHHRVDPPITRVDSPITRDAPPITRDSPADTRDAPRSTGDAPSIALVACSTTRLEGTTPTEVGTQHKIPGQSALPRPSNQTDQGRYGAPAARQPQSPAARSRQLGDPAVGGPATQRPAPGNPKRPGGPSRPAPRQPSSQQPASSAGPPVARWPRRPSVQPSAVPAAQPPSAPAARRTEPLSGAEAVEPVPRPDRS